MVLIHSLSSNVQRERGPYLLHQILNVFVMHSHFIHMTKLYCLLEIISSPSRRPPQHHHHPHPHQQQGGRAGAAVVNG